MMTESPLTALHVVGGNDPRGGVMSFVQQMASVPVPGVRHLVWKSRDFQHQNPALFVCEGRVRLIDVSVVRDFLGAMRDFGPLRRWMKGREKDLLLCAHSRMGIILTAALQRFTGVPGLIHLHARAGRPWFYRKLRQRLPMVFNSTRTCLHYGFNPKMEPVVPPTIPWPQKTNRLPGPARFAACGAFVPAKNFDLIIDAFGRLADATHALVIWGASDLPVDPLHQRHLVGRAAENSQIQIRPWSFNWLQELGEQDIFLHLPRSEGFGIVVLEAFAAGCRLVVPEGTFLDELPEPAASAGIFRCRSLEAEEVAMQMKAATKSSFMPGDLWRIRSGLEKQFGAESNAVRLAQIYLSVRGLNRIPV